MSNHADAPPPVAAELARVAFGDQPQRWPLPAAVSPHERWLRAVAAGGQGRYSSALADLEALYRMPDAAAHRSLAYSAHASFLRQLGDHRRARRWDGRAWATAGDDPDAGADALIGLAADALGIGRFAAAQRLLTRAEEFAAVGSPRLPVRWSWVAAELAMFRGEGPTAVTHAEAAVSGADTLGSVRHAIKSTVVLAAALCSAGAVPQSRQVADEAVDRAERYGLIPLRWAVCCLLADIGSSTLSAERVVAIRDQSADTVRRRGGVWTHR